MNIYLFVSSSIFQIFISHKIITHLLLTSFYIERQLSSRYHHAKRTIVPPLEGSSGLAHCITLLPLRRMLIMCRLQLTTPQPIMICTWTHCHGGWLASASDDNTIKIWDAATGSCTQTLEGHRHSVWSVASSLNSKVIASKSDDANPPHYQGYGIDLSQRWITRGSENWLWLPLEYQSRRSAVAASTVANGCSSGRVLTITFTTDS